MSPHRIIVIAVILFVFGCFARTQEYYLNGVAVHHVAIALAFVLVVVAVAIDITKDLNDKNLSV